MVNEYRDKYRYCMICKKKNFGHIAQPYKHILSVWHDGAGLPEGCGGHIVHKLSEG